MKIQISTPVCLTLAMLIVSGCSNGYYADLNQSRQYRATSGEETARIATRSPRSTPAVTTVRSNVARDNLELATARAGVVLNDAAPTGSISRDGSTGKLWPKRGTPEWDELQAEEIAREKRVNEVMRSICRGC